MRFCVSMICIVLCLVAGGCKERRKQYSGEPPWGDRSPPLEALPEISFEESADELLALPSDEERWKCVEGMVPESFAKQPGGVEEWAKWMILEACHVALLWLKAYPRIVRNLDFTVTDVQTLGEVLASREGKLRTSVRDANGAIVHRESAFSRAQVANRWLEKLLGRQFEDKAAFEKWFRAHQKPLVWNKALGTFEVLGTDGGRG